MIDYSQFSQWLILNQLLTRDMPRVVVDIGANDGEVDSNSRNLLEAGWHAVLVEPMPAVFRRLQENTKTYAGRVTLIEAACNDRNGHDTLVLGSGELPTMSRLESVPSASELAIRVATLTLGEIFRQGKIPTDFGVLLVDAETLDFRILDQLAPLPHRPRVIVTEDYAPTDAAKYGLLESLGYRFLGIWGADSFWLARWHPVDPATVKSLRLPIERLSSEWAPPFDYMLVEGLAVCDRFLRPTLIGWAYQQKDETQPEEVVFELRRVNFPARYLFRAHRAMRPDVAAHFGSPALRTSGVRCVIDVFPSDYDVTIHQLSTSSLRYSRNQVGVVSIPA